MQKPKIALGCDHGGYILKEEILNHLTTQGYYVQDFGIHNQEATDYPIIAHKVASEVVSKNFNLGILICGTGIGMSITANKHKGIRAAVVENTFSAKATKEHNNSNILCLGERVLEKKLAIEIVDIWLESEFQGGRHQKRIDMIENL